MIFGSNHDRVWPGSTSSGRPPCRLPSIARFPFVKDRCRAWPHWPTGRTSGCPGLPGEKLPHSRLQQGPGPPGRSPAYVLSEILHAHQCAWSLSIPESIQENRNRPRLFKVHSGRIVQISCQIFNRIVQNRMHPHLLPAYGHYLQDNPEPKEANCSAQPRAGLRH